MYYVCIENQTVIGIQSYEPSVPVSVTVSTISDVQYQQLLDQTHKFDVASNTVIPVDAAVLSQQNQDKLNSLEREFLNSTDWKILRHLRQKTLGISTSLTEAEYLELENQRQQAASRIV
jgi:hypothetical protein